MPTITIGSMTMELVRNSNGQILFSLLITLCSVYFLLMSTAAASYYSYYYYVYGQGTGPILMDDVACTGLEDGLINCTFDNNTGDCNHYYDAGVRCYSPPSSGEC